MGRILILRHYFSKRLGEKNKEGNPQVSESYIKETDLISDNTKVFRLHSIGLVDAIFMAAELNKDQNPGH